MAEIHVERKKGGGAKLWIVLLVIIVLAAVAYLWQAGYINLSYMGRESWPIQVTSGATLQV